MPQARPDPDRDSLYETATCIVKDLINRTGGRDEGAIGREGQAELDRATDNHLRMVAEAYAEYRLRQGTMADSTLEMTRTLQNFHGLRDYYSLVKSIGRSVAADRGAITDIVGITNRAVMRNFSGLPNSAATFQARPVAATQSAHVFIVHVRIFSEEVSLGRYSVQEVLLHKLGRTNGGSATIGTLDLIAQNLADPNARNLLIITRGDHAAGVWKCRCPTSTYSTISIAQSLLRHELAHAACLYGARTQRC